MRQLTESEAKTVFEKLASYTGKSLTNLIAPPGTVDSSDPSSVSSTRTQQQHVFRLQKDRVYYVPLFIANLAISVARDNLLSLGKPTIHRPRYFYAEY